MTTNHCTAHSSLDRFADVDCAACDDLRRERFFAAHPEKRASYEARVAAAAARKAKEAADAAAYAAKYRAVRDGDWTFDLASAPATHRRLTFDFGRGESICALAHDVSPESLASRLYAIEAQSTDGAVVCRLLRAETDEEIARRVLANKKEAA